MSQKEILDVTQILLKYTIPTLKLFASTVIFSIPLGMIVAMLKKCRFKPVAWLTNLYMLIMRGTPLMLQVIAIYYAIPYLKLSEDLPGPVRSVVDLVDIKSPNYMFVAVTVAFSLNYAAYFAEIFRGGIEAIPKGQYEAAACLGMTKSHTFFRIILPQVIKRILPASSNEIIILIKDTSLANVIAYSEIIMKAKQQMQLYSSLTPLFIAGVFYLAATIVLTGIFALIEKKLDYYK